MSSGGNRWTRLGALGLLLALGSCAGAVESSKLEDGARRTVPVPICLRPLPRHGAPGVVPTLKSEDYWATLLPSFDPGGGTVDRTAPDCSGRQLLTAPEWMQTEGARTGPIPVTEADVGVSPGPDGFKIVWLRTHRFADGNAGGLLALVRAREAYAEVYAVGLHRANPARSRFAFERLGPEILVTATEEGCADVKPNQSCETTMVAYLMKSGELVPGTRFAIDRIHYGQAAGIAGTVQFRLRATPLFQERSIRLGEQIIVRDAAQNEIRKSDLERTFQLQGRAKLVASGDSLWTQVVGASAPPAPASRPPAPPSPPPR